MTDSAVAEGHVKLRDGKKWKSRWVVLRKPSPVADCLVLLVSKERGAKEKSSVVLEHICGLETGGGSEGVSFALTILSLNQIIQLGFDSKETLQAWDLRLHYYLGEVHSFKVTVLPGTTLESGPATLHLCNNLLVIARDFPPVITGQWNLLDLRRYGPVANGFVFEGGTRCGYWTGVFFVSCAEGEQISFLFDCIVRGISPSRGPFGIKPLLPESSVSAASAEERLNQETEELAKRLSLLSNSTASTSSFSSSAVGDDRSMSGSSENSETSHSDSSIGSRMTLWAQPVPSAASGSSRTTSHGDEKSPNNSETGPKVPPKPTHSRTLQEIGRQNSSDSGIATGSHSSYSGSFSSYEGNLDTGSPKEEYGTLLSLPPPSNPEKHPCTCPVSHTHEYQVPSSLRYLYDTPRSLLEARENKEAAAHEKTEMIKEQTEVSAAECFIPVSQSTDTHADCLIRSPHLAASRTLFTTCPLCGGLKRAPLPQTGTARQHEVAGGKSARLNFGGSVHPEQQPQTHLCSISTRSTSLMSPKTSDKLQEASPENYLYSLSDLLGHYSPGKSDTMSIKASLADPAGQCCSLENSNQVPTGPYMPMSSALSKPHCAESCQPSRAVSFHQTSRSSIYENCHKCRKGLDGCMTPTTGPPVIRGGLTSPAELKISEGQGHSSLLQELGLKIQHDTEPHPAILNSSPVLQLNDGEPTVGDKQRSHVDGGRMDPAYKITESQATDRSSELDEKSRFEWMGSCGQQQRADDTEGCTGVSDRPREVTYVNIPISPTSKKQLHYMELELQEHGTTIRGKGTTKYAQIDIAVTEAAHRVGTQHALGREAGLQRLEQLRRGGAPQ